ncbi:MAG: hypothetical protein ACP5MC_03010 [Candidatus Micrarchaeia archaeon]
MEIKVGSKIRNKKIKEIIYLSNGWLLLKTENGKSAQDFRVRLVTSTNPLRSMVPKHAHFAIDLYGKLCQDKSAGLTVLNAIYEVWKTKDVKGVLQKYQNASANLQGYPLEYILYALKWILEQEDINFTSRPEKKQNELDAILSSLGYSVPEGRLGSELAMSLLCDVGRGTHPVEALLKANLDIVPRRKY